jgi:hypothetical protein
MLYDRVSDDNIPLKKYLRWSKICTAVLPDEMELNM